MTAVLLLVAGAALGGLVTVLLSRLTPRLVFHPDIHWSAERGGTASACATAVMCFNGTVPARRPSISCARLTDGATSIDVTMTATLVVPDGPANWHRLNVPALNGNFAHLQPGDTRFLALDLTGLSAAAQDILRAAAKSRTASEKRGLLDQLRGWTGAYVLVEAIGNDAWSAGRRCREQRYPLSGPSIAVRAGSFPIGLQSDCTACDQPGPSAARSPPLSLTTSGS